MVTVRASAGVGWAVDKMLEDHFYWILVYWRWLDDANFARGPRGFFKRAPAIVRPLVEKIVRRQIRKNLHRQGLGRHSEAEMTAMASRGIEALAQILGDNRYLLGPQPSGADATAFAFIAGCLTSTFESPVCERMKAMNNLVAYRDRMMAEFYPDFGK